MLTQTKCDQCGKYFEISREAFFLRRMDDDGDPWRLCSTSCLVEKAWELRDRQPKLSKSAHVEECGDYMNPNWVGKRADE